MKKTERDREAGPRVLSSFSRPLAAVGLAVVGFSLVILLLGAGIVLIIAVLDSTCCPPLNPQQNFGQFGLFLLYIAPMFLACGLVYFLIPFLRWWFWSAVLLSVYLLGYLLTFGPAEFASLQSAQVALHVAGLVLCLLGIVARLVYLYFEYDELRTRAAANEEPW